MKTFVQAAVIFLIVLAASLLCFNLITGNTTDNEAEKALAQSVEQSMYNALTNEVYSIHNNDEFIADFLTNLSLQVDSGASLHVRVIDADYVEGLLDVEVTETLTYPDGKTREVSCRRTVILEDKPTGALSLADYSGEVTAPNKLSVSINNGSGGNLRVKTANASVATATVDGNVLTIKPGKTKGTTTITVTSAATTEYKSESVVYTVVVK